MVFEPQVLRERSTCPVLAQPALYRDGAAARVFPLSLAVVVWDRPAAFFLTIGVHGSVVEVRGY